MNLGAIYLKRLFCSKTTLGGYPSSGTVVFADTLPEESATQAQD